MLNIKDLLAIRDKYLASSDTDVKKDVLALLGHIQEEHECNRSRGRAAYEVFSISNGQYSKRMIYDMVWTKAEAKRLAAHRNAMYSVIHVILIDGRWHRVYVTELQIEGRPETADLSRHKEWKR